MTFMFFGGGEGGGTSGAKEGTADLNREVVSRGDIFEVDVAGDLVGIFFEEAKRPNEQNV